MEESISILRSLVERGKELHDDYLSKIKRLKESLDGAVLINELMMLPVDSWTKIDSNCFSTEKYSPLKIELRDFGGRGSHSLYLYFGAIKFEKRYWNGYESILEELYNALQRRLEITENGRN